MPPTFEVQLRLGDSVKNPSRFGYGKGIRIACPVDSERLSGITHR